MGSYLASILSALSTGVLMMYALGRWIDTPAESYTADDFKRAFIEAGAITQLHNEVYASVGEKAWEEIVKPSFIMNMTMRVALDTNNVLPGPDDLIKWASDHPDETREMLQRYLPPAPEQ